MKKENHKYLLVSTIAILLLAIVIVIYFFELRPISIAVPKSCFEFKIAEETIASYVDSGIVKSMEVQGNSVLMAMNNGQYRKMMKNVCESAEKILDNIPLQSATSNILSVNANSDFSEFTVKLIDEEFTKEDTEIISTLNYVHYIYSCFTQKDAVAIKLNLVSNKTGKIFGSVDLSHLFSGELTEFETKFLSFYVAGNETFLTE